MESATYIIIGAAVLIVVWYVFRRRDGISNITKPIDPIAEAEVYLAYERNEQAIEVLENHLRDNPKDAAVIKRLAEIKGEHHN
jgi:Tfp pilus assembly protein FimV